MKVFKGIVVSGSGSGRFYTTLPWVKRQIRDKLGFTPYPGTLNLKVGGEARRLIEENAKMEITPAEGFYRGLIVKVSIQNRVEAAAVIAKTPNYPDDLVEIVASENLRDKLNLKDGDTVNIRVKPINQNKAERDPS